MVKPIFYDYDEDGTGLESVLDHKDASFVNADAYRDLRSRLEKLRGTAFKSDVLSSISEAVWKEGTIDIRDFDAIVPEATEPI